MNRNQRKTVLATTLGAVGAGFLFRGLLRAHRRMDFANRTVVITGGSRGLGLCLARRFVDQGAKVAICARDEAELNRARDELTARGGDVLAVQCDITSPPQITGMINGIIGHFGSLDVLVNNAGVIQVGPIDTMTIADFDHAMKTHFYAPLLAIEAALPQMRRQGEGRIVNIASIGGKVAVPHLVPYSASKFALVGLSESLRMELRRENIYVTTVCPGLMRTGSPRNADFKGKHEKEHAWFATSDALPIVSIDADRMAKRIINAAQHGQAELITPMIANLQAKAYGLFPGVFGEMLGCVNDMLPEGGGIGRRSAKGYQSDRMQPEFARERNEAAAQRNNEVVH
jgi:NAD(P)-dependent dehydrogenase (short-subunit alcohol dehydrogenase family)